MKSNSYGKTRKQWKKNRTENTGASRSKYYLNTAEQESAEPMNIKVCIDTGENRPVVTEETRQTHNDAPDIQEILTYPEALERFTYDNNEVINVTEVNSEVSKLTTPQSPTSTKRYYVDRDEPNEENQKICYWHKRGDCKFGVNCFHTEEERQQYEEHLKAQPFRPEAQRDWANTEHW